MTNTLYILMLVVPKEAYTCNTLAWSIACLCHVLPGLEPSCLCAKDKVPLEDSSAKTMTKDFLCV